MRKKQGNHGNFAPGIDKDIPIPRPYRRQQQGPQFALPTAKFHENHAPGLRITYPFERMEVGDSFFVPNAGKMPLYVRAHKFRNDPENDALRWKFALRQWHDGENYGYRMWRIS